MKSPNTWDCGTPRSTHNCFNWKTDPEPAKPMTPSDINRAKAREAWRRKQATRVNQDRYIGGGPTNSERAAR